MFHVEHFMKHDVVNHVVRNCRGIEHTADENRMVKSVVAAKNVARTFLGPGQFRSVDCPIEVLLVESVESTLQVDMAPASVGSAWRPAAFSPGNPRPFL